MQEKLLDRIAGMTVAEQQSYFESLTQSQRDFVYGILQEAARPKAKCDLFDDSANFVNWITGHFYIPELNGPMWLADYQKIALNEATKKNDDGLYAYSLIAWMDIKKSIKSCIAAAVALRMAFKTKWGSIKVVANKKEQAKSRSYFYITRALKLNPEMRALLDEGAIQISNYTIKFNFNDAIIQAVPLNPEGEAGGNDDLIIWTEAWAARSKAAKTMFTEMVIPPNKFGRGFKWLESYAGFSGESPILEPIYENNVKPENKIHASLPLYANGRTFALCNHTPRLPWQTSQYYLQQATELTEAEFNRVHKNMWQAATSKFVDKMRWSLCKRKLPVAKPKEKLILGMDVGTVSDNFAIVGVTKINKKLAVRVVKVWRPEKGKDFYFSNPNPNDKKNDINYPYGWIVQLAKQYKIVMIAYDPYQCKKLAEDLMVNRVAYCKEFPQQSLREKSDKYLLDIIKEQDIIHDGNETLSTHIDNANAHHTGNNRLRLIKRKNSLKIDAAVALSMAAYTAKDYNL